LSLGERRELLDLAGGFAANSCSSCSTISRFNRSKSALAEVAESFSSGDVVSGSCSPESLLDSEDRIASIEGELRSLFCCFAPGMLFDGVLASYDSSSSLSLDWE
jgi:hypothetical protein